MLLYLGDHLSTTEGTVRVPIHTRHTCCCQWVRFVNKTCHPFLQCSPDGFLAIPFSIKWCIRSQRFFQNLGKSWAMPVRRIKYSKHTSAILAIQRTIYKAKYSLKIHFFLSNQREGWNGQNISCYYPFNLPAFFESDKVGTRIHKHNTVLCWH